MMLSRSRQGSQPRTVHSPKAFTRSGPPPATRKRDDVGLYLLSSTAARCIPFPPEYASTTSAEPQGPFFHSLISSHSLRMSPSRQRPSFWLTNASATPEAFILSFSYSLWSLRPAGAAPAPPGHRRKRTRPRLTKATTSTPGNHP